MKYVAAASQSDVYDSTELVAEALEVCCRANVPAAAVEVMEQVLSRRPLDSDYVDNFLMQILSEMPGVCRPLDVLGVFPQPLKTTLSAWIEEVLGPKPQVNCSTLLASISQWDCGCYHCQCIRSFFTALKSDVYTKDRIRTSDVQHLKEKFLNDNKEFMTWTLGSDNEDSDQSEDEFESSWTTLKVCCRETSCKFLLIYLQVVIRKGMFEALRWEKERKRGKSCIDALSNDKLRLVQVLGPDIINAVSEGEVPTNKIPDDVAMDV